MSIPVRTREGFPAHSVGQASVSAIRTPCEGSKSFVLRFFFVRILVAHLDDPKYHFFGKFVDFCSPRRRFSKIWGPKTGPGSLLFQCFLKNGDFVEIVLPLWWEHNFQGSDLPKIDLEIDCERQRRTTSKKTASEAVSERTFSVPGSFWVDFGVPLGSQDGLFGSTFGRFS